MRSPFHVNFNSLGGLFNVFVGVTIVLAAVLVGSLLSFSIAKAESVTVNCSGTSGSPTAVDEASLAADDVTFSDTGGDGYCVLDAAISANSVVVGLGVVLTHAAEDSTGVNITTTGNLTLTGEILVTGKGCAGGAQNTDGSGPNTGTGVCAATTSGYGDAGRGGAGHGGPGGAPSLGGGTAGIKYGSPLAPTLLGSGGAGGPNGGETGGAGGGKVRLDVGGTLFVDGAIKANGDAPPVNMAAGGGSGGSIYITTDTLDTTSGTGAAVQANGGNAYSYGGAGGGGRVAVYYNTLASDGTNFALTNITSTKGSRGTNGNDGNPGSTFILDRKSDDGAGNVRVTTGLDLIDGGDFARTSIILDSGSTIVCDAQTTLNFTATGNFTDNGSTFNCTAAITTANITATDTLTTAGVNWDFTNTTTVNLSAATWTSSGTNTIDVTKAGSAMDWNVTNALTLNNLTYTGATPGTSASTGGVLSMDNAIAVSLVNTDINSNVNWTGLSSLSIDLNSSISANGKGCDGGPQSGDGYGPNTSSGVCTQSTSGYGASNRVGAGHGGAGGRSNFSASTGATYGSSTAPVLYGSGGGGGGNSGEIGGAGGGKIRLDMTGTFTLNGTLSANGSAPANSAGGGSGGSVYVTMSTLAGSGTANSVTADGGAGITHGGGGGGGRIVLSYGTSALSSGTIDSMMRANGGASGGTGAAAAGSAGSMTRLDAAPTISSAATGNTELSASVNQLTITFSEQVDIVDANAEDGFDGFTLTPSSGACSISNWAYGATDTTTLTLNVSCTTTNNTAITINPTYTTAGSNTVIDNGSTEMANGETETGTDGAEPYPVSLTYKDVVSVNGQVDRVDIVFSEALSGFSYSAGDWSFSVASELTLSDTGASLGTTTVANDTVLLTVSADTNETGHITTPTLVYTNAAANVMDAGNNQTETWSSAQNVSDGAKPRAKTATFYDAASTDGKLDLITVVFTENISAAANGAADWALTSAANFSSLVEGTVECNSGAAGANECDYNFTTATVKTNVGDLSLVYTAGSSVTDGTNTASSITVSSATSPAFTDAAAPEAVDAQISIAGASGTGGAYKVSDTVTATWNAANSSDINSVTANLSGWGGSATAAMTDTTACGGTASNNIYEACYTITGSEAIDTTNVNVSVNATDTASNNRSNSDTSNATVDTVVPIVTAAKISVTGATGTSGAFKNGDTAVGRWDNSATGDNNSDTISSVTINASAFDDGSSSLSGSVASGIYTATVGTLDSQDDTNNNVTVTVVDNAGNSTATAGTNNYTVDTIVPTLTNTNITVTGCAGTSGACKNGDTATARWDNAATGDNNSDTIASVTFNASAFDDGSSSLSGTAASGIYTATVGTLDSQDDTGNTITATVVDNAGNSTGPTTSSVSYTVDTIVPTLTNTNITVTGCAGTSGACKNGDTATARWDNAATGDNNSDTIASVTFNASAFDDGSSSLSGTAASGIYTATVGTLDSQDDTGNTITATVVDNAGNSTGPTTSSASYTVDTIVPTVTAAKISVTGATGTSGAFKNGDTSVGRWDNSATGDNNSDTLASVTINASAFDDGSSSLSGTAASGIYTATVGTLDSQDDASNNVTVTVVDNAGNSTATAGTNNYTVDTIVPTVTQASITVAGCTGTSGACRAVDSPVLTWNPTTSGESDTMASATFNGSSLKTGDSALTGALATNWTVSLSGAMTSQDDTGNTITVTVVDNAGNSTGPTTSSASYTADTILPTLSTAVYQDANSDGRVDRIVLTMSEDVSNGFTADKDEWSFGQASELTLVAPTADASVTNATTTVTLSVGADANETGHTTAPTLSYTNVAGTLKDDAGNALANFTAQAVTDGAAPFLRSSSPANDDQNVSRMDDVVLTFTEAITTASFTYTCCGTGTDPGSRVVTWSSSDTVANIAHAQFQSSNDITIDITAAPDGASNAFAGALSGAADPFTFKTAAAGGIVAGVNDDRIAGGSTVNPTLAVASPNGGETVTTGEEISIAWTQKGRIDTVNVHYSTDGGNTWSDIARAVRNMGYARWVVPNMVTTTARIMVEGTDLATIFGGDQSDGEFTIKPVDVPVTALVPVPEPIPTVQDKIVTRRLLPTESPLPPHLLPIIPLPVSETPEVNGLPVGDDGAVSLAKIAKPLPLGAPVVRMELPKREMIELAVGNVFRGVSNPAVYVMRSDGTRSVFPDTDTYDSYFNNFDHVLTVNDDQLRKIPSGKRMTVRPGTWLVKIQSDPRVYTIEQGRVLRHIPDENTARFLYGKNWNRQVRDVNVAFFRDYEVGDPLPPNAYLPDGTVFSYEEEPQLFILQNRIRRLFLDAESFIFNNYREQFIRNVSLLFEFDEGQPVRSTDPELMKDLVGG